MIISIGTEPIFQPIFFSMKPAKIGLAWQYCVSLETKMLRSRALVYNFNSESPSGKLLYCFVKFILQIRKICVLFLIENRTSNSLPVQVRIHGHIFYFVPACVPFTTEYQSSKYSYSACQQFDIVIAKNLLKAKAHTKTQQTEYVSTFRARYWPT